MSDQETQLKAIENRITHPTMEEWVGILHDIAIDSEAPMERRIRALAQMDRITGTPGSLDVEAVNEYVSFHLGDY